MVFWRVLLLSISALFVASGIGSVIAIHVLLSNLRRQNPLKWSELTTIPGWGPGAYNGFRALGYLFGKDVPVDPRQSLYRRLARTFALSTVACFATLFGIVVLLAVLAANGRRF